MTWTTTDIPDPTGRTAVVTGVNGGLGFESARVLAGKGAHVVMAVRDLEQGGAARDAILDPALGASLELVLLDVASLTSVRTAGAAIAAAHPWIDILVNNAGVMAIPNRRSLDRQELQFATNHLGHFAITALLTPALLMSGAGRVVSVTSTGRYLGRPVAPGGLAPRKQMARRGSGSYLPCAFA